MADNQTQRPYRSNQSPARAPASPSNSANDPLAELARLIGQTDPFAEFGRDDTRRFAPPPAAEPATDRSAPPAAQMPAQEPHQPYADPSCVVDADLFHGESEVPGYPTAQAGGYEANAYHQQQMQQDSEHEPFYEDSLAPRRRMGIMAIAAVFALAVIGTAGALGYRAVFGTSGSNKPPPVIKADTTPSKIVPANSNKTPNKLIHDRVADHAQNEKLVSREEQPVEMKAAAMAPAQGETPPVFAQPPALGSGVLSTEPKKIHTITIHAGGEGPLADTQRVTAAPAPPPPPPPVAVAAPREASPHRVAGNAPVELGPQASPAPRHSETRAAPAQRAAAPVQNYAPLSLSPNATSTNTAASAARAPMRSASVAASAQIASRGTAPSGSYAVQVSSQRSEAEAQASFRSLQQKYPNQLGGRQAMIHRVELGAKGTYYRAMVGPFASANEASALCSSLKAAGGQCLVQRN
jgi:hypothetical protein